MASYTDERLLEILRDLAAELGRTPTAKELVACHDLPSLNTYRRYFKSWNAALEAAGLEPCQQALAYTDEKLLQTLRDLAAELGCLPTTQDLLARRDLPSPGVYRIHFGSWNAALEAAGLTPYRRTPVYTDEQLLQTLRDLAAELGRSPTQHELRARRDLPSLGAYRKHFGGWNAALEAAGLQMRCPQDLVYTNEQLLQTLRDLAAELGRSPNGNEMLACHNLPTSTIYYNRFGSWNAALETAGLTPHRRTAAYSDEQLLQTLRDLAAELGRSPTVQELFIRRDLPSHVTYYRHFGSWTAALEAVGLTPNRRPPVYSDEQLLQTLRDLAAELGRLPTQLELRARRDLPSPITYHRHFGSWTAALEAAGLKLNRAR